MAEIAIARGRLDRGQSLVEMALVLPLLLILFGGIVDFGLLFQRYEVLTNAAERGARIAVLQANTDADFDPGPSRRLHRHGAWRCSAERRPHDHGRAQCGRGRLSSGACSP